MSFGLSRTCLWTLIVVAYFATGRMAYADMSAALEAWAFCAQRPLSTMSEDRTIFCFNGKIDHTFNLDTLRSLQEHGRFVIQSGGGNNVMAMMMADILLEKDADIVIRDYCLSACANAIFVASRRTYVMKDAIVAWHGGFTGFSCRGDAPVPTNASDSDRRAWIESFRIYCDNREALSSFYRRRDIKDGFTHAPQTFHANKMFKLMSRQEVLDKRRIFWMWHPENFNGYFKSEIVFQSYPKEDEIATLLRRRGLSTMRLVYDPPDEAMIGRKTQSIR